MEDEAKQQLRTLARLAKAAANDELADEDAAEWYAAVQELRRAADYYERGLIRHLKHEQGRTWQEVADLVDANLSSRQAAYVKWKRLIDGDRREYGGAGRGGWQKGRPRKDQSANA